MCISEPVKVMLEEGSGVLKGGISFPQMCVWSTEALHMGLCTGREDSHRIGYVDGRYGGKSGVWVGVCCGCVLCVFVCMYMCVGVVEGGGVSIACVPNTCPLLCM